MGQRKSPGKLETPRDKWKKNTLYHNFGGIWGKQCSEGNLLLQTPVLKKEEKSQSIILSFTLRN